MCNAFCGDGDGDGDSASVGGLKWVGWRAIVTNYWIITTNKTNKLWSANNMDPNMCDLWLNS